MSDYVDNRRPKAPIFHPFQLLVRWGKILGTELFGHGVDKEARRGTEVDLEIPVSDRPARVVMPTEYATLPSVVSKHPQEVVRIPQWIPRIHETNAHRDRRMVHDDIRIRILL